MQLSSAHKKPFTAKRRAIWRCAYAVELACVCVRISVADTADVCDGVEEMLQTLRHRRLRAVRDETRAPVQTTETAESLPRDKRGRFHRPHPTGTVPADVHAKFCTSVEKAVQTSKVTHESLVAQKGCCLRGKPAVLGHLSHRNKKPRYLMRDSNSQPPD